MKTFYLALIAVGAVLSSINAHAQEFPQGASTPTASEVNKHLADKVFNVKLADGSSWRLEFKGGGHFFVNTSNGFNGTGQWQAEDGRLCSQLKGGDRNCGDVRFHQELFYAKRATGEIIQYVPR